MKKFFVSALFLVAGLSSFADNFKYAVMLIDSTLLKNTNAVVRQDETYFQVNSTIETITRTHFVITILNEKADEYANIVEGYSKHEDIVSMEATLYDAFGKEIKKIRKKDTEDLSAVSGITLMTDERLKHYNFYYKVYPYTMEYSCETKGKATLFFPKWMPQVSQNISVENSSITIAANPSYKLRYKAFNYNGEPEITDDKDLRYYKWMVHSLKPVIREPYSPMLHEMVTMVIFGPSEFQMDDYKGNMETWQDFGKFVYALKRGKDILPPAVKTKVHELTDVTTDKKEKIRKLYEYMQQNTRYILVTLGIGGWQPFDAQYVSSNGYGDCKALSNYMYSLLKEAGINSYYTLIRAGKYEKYITEDFPSQQFNHVIVSVPLEKDTMWLECTSQTLPAGYLSSFTCDRPALLIDENGGTLTRTPVYGPDVNTELQNVKAVLSETGALSINATSIYGGLQQDYYHSLIHSLSKDKIKEQLHEQLDFTTYDIGQFNYVEQKSSKPIITESLQIEVSDYATITGKRLFVIPNVMARSKSRIMNDTSRKYDIVIPYGYHDVDSVEIQLPTGYKAEAIPQPSQINSPFGTYRSSVKLEGNKLVYLRQVDYINGRFPATAYADFVKFYESMYKADRGKVVLSKSM